MLIERYDSLLSFDFGPYKLIMILNGADSSICPGLSSWTGHLLVVVVAYKSHITS